jgi:hypothetical protein
MRRAIRASAASRYVAATWMLVVCGLCAVSSPAAGRSQGGGGKVNVNPPTGGPRTDFTISFRAPDRAGTYRGRRRWYEISATGPHSGGSCDSGAAAQAAHARRHSRVRVKLRPGAGGWCPGAFQGKVVEEQAPVCPPREICPRYVVLVKTVGRFSFQLRSRDTTPPTFAGLKSAVACTPGPQRPGQTTPYTLRWDAAHDNVTPSSQIRYDIFMATKSRGEDFSDPTWTSAPGATSFKTPGLPSHRTVYFVVRARDQAGNEDKNRVQRRGVDPCV